MPAIRVSVSTTGLKERGPDAWSPGEAATHEQERAAHCLGARQGQPIHRHNVAQASARMAQDAVGRSSLRSVTDVD